MASRSEVRQGRLEPRSDQQACFESPSTPPVGVPRGFAPKSTRAKRAFTMRPAPPRPSDVKVSAQSFRRRPPTHDLD